MMAKSLGSLARTISGAVNKALGLPEKHIPHFITNTTSEGDDFISLAWDGFEVTIKLVPETLSTEINDKA